MELLPYIPDLLRGMSLLLLLGRAELAQNNQIHFLIAGALRCCDVRPTASCSGTEYFFTLFRLRLLLLLFININIFIIIIHLLPASSTRRRTTTTTTSIHPYTTTTASSNVSILLQSPLISHAAITDSILQTEYILALTAIPRST